MYVLQCMCFNIRIVAIYLQVLSGRDVGRVRVGVRDMPGGIPRSNGPLRCPQPLEPAVYSTFQTFTYQSM